MTQQPFSRPGAIDLSGTRAPPAAAGAPAAGGPAAPAGPPAARRTAVDVNEQNFQSVLEASMTAPVLLVFFSAHPDARERPARRRPGRRGRASSRAASSSGSWTSTPSPQIAQAMQIPSVPLVVAVVDGRPMPLLQDALPLEELRTALTQVGQQLTTQGITGRHQPARRRAGRGGRGGGRRPALRRRRRTRWPRATSTARSRSTRSSSTPTRPTPRPPAASRWPRSCSAPRASTSTPPGPRPRTTPTTSTRRPWSPTSTCSAGTSRTRSPGSSNLVARTVDPDKAKARDHLLGLFAAVGNDDPRVLRGTRNLASALF